MKFGAALLASATCVAIVYGVLFSVTYPRVEINSGIAALCALAGLVTCLAAVGLWKLVMGSKAS
jgi:hypothetical protein